MSQEMYILNHEREILDATSELTCQHMVRNMGY
jgi:hypothetical protein